MQNQSIIRLLTVGLSRSENNSLSVMLPRRLQREVLLGEAADQSPDVIIINFDHRTGEERYEELRQRHPQVPFLGLSLKEMDRAGIPFLRRPVNMDALVKTIQSLLHVENKSEAQQIRIAPTSIAPTKRSIQVQTPFPTGTGKGHLIRTMQRIARKAQEEEKNILFLEPKGNVAAFLFLSNGLVYTSNKPAVLRSLCRLQIPEPFPSKILEDGEAEAFIAWERTGLFYDPVNLLWEIAYGYTRNGLPGDLEPSDLLQLRQWPNCTTARYPMANLLLAALFHQQPHSIESVTAHSGVPASEVRCFAGAAYLLGYLEKAEAQEEAASTAHSRRAQTRESTHAPGMLRVLANKVMGRLFHRATAH